jgi:hypothetical protein
VHAAAEHHGIERVEGEAAEGLASRPSKNAVVVGGQVLQQSLLTCRADPRSRIYLIGSIGEHRKKIGAQHGGARRNHEGDQRDQETIFNHCGSALIAVEAPN